MDVVVGGEEKVRVGWILETDEMAGQSMAEMVGEMGMVEMGGTGMVEEGEEEGEMDW